jgi:flagellar basal body-associated protein FliL
MVRKAKLDVLDVAGDEEKGSATDDQKTEEGLSGKRRIYLRKPLLWISVISGTALALIAAVSLWIHTGYNTKAPVSQKVEVASGNSTILKEQGVKEEMILFKDFIIDLKDRKDHIAVIFCDLAIEPEEARFATAIKKHTGTRNMIYSLLKTKKAAEFTSVDHRAALKTELKKDLNGLLGEEAVKNIYFSRLEVI